MAITFHTADIKFSLPKKRKLKDFILSQILSSSGYHIVTLSFVFCTDEYLRAINKKFLNHDYYTDIITFPLNNDKRCLEGEIYISIDRVRENSVKFGASGLVSIPQSANRNLELETELNRVMFHGVLHLLGHKDKTKAQKEEMSRMEDKWLRSFND